MRQRGKRGGNCEVGLPFESKINNFSLHLGRQTNCRINSKSQLAGQGKGEKTQNEKGLASVGREKRQLHPQI